MNLKRKSAFSISVLFTLMYAVSASIIYFLFADFRKDEFENRLKEKAVSSIKLLVEVEQVDQQLLKVIDENSINKLYNEKTLIFNADYQLIYSSLDDTKIKWSIADLNELKLKKTFFRKDNENEVYGFFFDTLDKDYFALVSADDTYGKRKLTYLLYILIFTYLFFTALAWFFSYKFVKRLLSPIDLFHKKIKSITENNLNIRLEIKQDPDEIDLLAVEFNQMLDRINQSYQKQREFTANASHELRTPIARLIAQLENKIIEEKKNQHDITFIQTIHSDVNQLSELTHSLLLLSKLESRQAEQKEVCRVDDILFEVSGSMKKLYPDFKMDFTLDDIEKIEVLGYRSLLIIAFNNLFKNAYLYSYSKTVGVHLYTQNDCLMVNISNDGKTISNEEQNKLFEPFMRGENAKSKSGLGLGLRIVKRILNQEGAAIEYFNKDNKTNTFTITFPKN